MQINDDISLINSLALNPNEAMENNGSIEEQSLPQATEASDFAALVKGNVQGRSLSAQAKKIGSNLADKLLKTSKNLEAFSRFIKEDVPLTQPSDSILIMTGKLSQVSPEKIPQAVVNNQFLTEALAQDIPQLLDSKLPIDKIAQMLGINDEVMASAQEKGIDIREAVPVKDFLKAIGIDPQKVYYHLTKLKEKVLADGVDSLAEENTSKKEKNLARIDSKAKKEKPATDETTEKNEKKLNKKNTAEKKDDDIIALNGQTKINNTEGKQNLQPIPEETKKEKTTKDPDTQATAQIQRAEESRNNLKINNDSKKEISHNVLPDTSRLSDVLTKVNTHKPDPFLSKASTQEALQEIPLQKMETDAKLTTDAFKKQNELDFANIQIKTPSNKIDPDFLPKEKSQMLLELTDNSKKESSLYLEKEEDPSNYLSDFHQEKTKDSLATTTSSSEQEMILTKDLKSPDRQEKESFQDRDKDETKNTNIKFKKSEKHKNEKIDTSKLSDLFQNEVTNKNNEVSYKKESTDITDNFRTTLAEKISSLAETNNNQAIIELDDKNNKVKLDIKIENNDVSIKVLEGNEHLKNIFDKDISSLRQALSLHNLNLSSFNSNNFNENRQNIFKNEDIIASNRSFKKENNIENITSKLHNNFSTTLPENATIQVRI